MSITYFITGICLFSTLSLVFIWFAERPVNRTKLKVFATLLYLVLIGASIYFHQSEQRLNDTTEDFKMAQSTYDAELLALKEDYEKKLAWQEIEIERELRTELEARYAYKEDSLNASLITKNMELEEIIKEQRSEIYQIQDQLREALATNEILRNDLEVLQSYTNPYGEEPPEEAFVEFYSSCEELNLYYPDGLDIAHDAYSFTLDEDGDGVACGPSEQ